MPFLKMRLSRFGVGVSLPPIGLFSKRCYLLEVTKERSQRRPPFVGPGVPIDRSVAEA
jgi:hypothetical protein